jgi:UDP-GlcNAc:undecaprenyl-phosphate GlcNAc-1-phosphate transferase
MGEWNENRVIACSIPILILGVPLFDFAYILIARIVKGQTRDIRSVIEHCAMDHLSHRLTWIGFSQRQAVLLIYFLCVILGVSGILMRNSESLFDSVLGIAQGLAIFFLVVILMATAERRRRKPHWDRKEDLPPPATPKRRGTNHSAPHEESSRTVQT